jgi:hypothetical protein
MTVKPGWARQRDRQRRREVVARRAGAAQPLWALSPAEWRLLVITFAGGLGSIVAAACVIGGAIALARYQEKFGLKEFAVLTGVALLAFPVMLIITRPWSGGSLRERILVIATFAFGGFAVVLALLVWIGVAAGIH